MKWLLGALFALPCAALAQEMAGQLGSRDAVMVLHAVRQPDGGWHVTGEYVVFPTLQRRFLEGERSPQLGVTTLKEGATAILFGHDPTGELRGTWRDGVFKGTRYGPGGQERERFEFSEDFPSLESYGATVRCEVHDASGEARLAYAVAAGQVQSFEWRARDAAGKSCTLDGLAQQPMKGGIRLASGGCRVTLRDLGEQLRVAAEGCEERCQAPVRLEPLLVDRRGNCEPFRPQVRVP